MADPRLDELWSEVLARWADEPAHVAFLEHCRLSRQLDIAARRYREISQRPDPYRDDGTFAEVARKRLRAVATLAMFELEGSRIEREARGHEVRSRRLLVRAVFVFLIFAGLLALALRRL